MLTIVVGKDRSPVEGTLMFRAVTRPILVVDDHDDTREMVSALLVEHGLSVLQASNGKEALDLLVAAGAEEPFLILLDLEMPVMTGWEFLRLVRNEYRLACIPVLVTSGSHAYSDELSGVAGFLRKPYALDELLMTIGALGCARPARLTKS